MTDRRSVHPFLDHPRPIAFAHRGGALEAEENTLPAFARAVALGYSHVELDVHATEDGAVVVHHDSTLARMTGDPRAIASLDLAGLQRVRTHGGAAIPQLAEILDAFPDLCIAIEIKAPAAVGPLARVIADHDALDRVCVGSFDPSTISAARALLGPGLCWSPAHAGIARLWLAGWCLAGWAGTRAPDRFHAALVPPAFHGVPVVTARFVRAAHARGVQVHVWTVDRAAEMTRLLDLGVDGIMTDRPTLLRDVLRARGQWHRPVAARAHRKPQA